MLALRLAFLLLRIAMQEPVMKVAIPLFGSRVSPRFDCAGVLWLAEVSGTRVVPGQHVVDGVVNPLQRVARLRELGVNAVVCGAITGFLLRHLNANGIAVYPWVAGEAHEALAALARGELKPAASAVPRVGATGAQARGVRRGRGRRPGRGPRWSR